jgi:tRNA pseudouridine38-40 synthase
MSFLGFRYSGWQIMPGERTVEGMLHKTLSFIWEHKDFKTLGCGRTDAKVSAKQFFAQINTNEILDLSFLEVLNDNLPNDIFAKHILKKSKGYSVLSSSKSKTYRYQFCVNSKRDVFKASFAQHFKGDIDLDKMRQGLKALSGEHNFSCFTVKNSNPKNTLRTLEVSPIEYKPENDLYFIEFKSSGFMRYQVRLMMGALVMIARDDLSLDNLRDMLRTGVGLIKTIAPGSGLVLQKVELAE